MKTSGKVKSRRKPAAIYNGVALPKDATQRRRMRNKLSAQVHRKRKQDALASGKHEVEQLDVVINKLKENLNDTSAKVTSLQSIMDTIKSEFGDELVQHILQQCNQQLVEGTTAVEMDSQRSARSVTSESDTLSSSSSSSYSDDESFGCSKEETRCAGILTDLS